jgi:signal transduction histidine kinase
MNLATITTLGFGISSGLYLAVAIASLMRRNFRGGMAYSLTVYAVVACFLALWQVAGRLGGLPFLRADFVLARFPLYGAFALAVFFYYLTRSFLRIDRMEWRGWIGGAIVLGGLIALDANVFLVEDVLLRGAGWFIERNNFIVFGLVCGWAAFTGAATWQTYRAYRQTEQPLHRNRLMYWLPALSLILLGDAMLFAQQTLTGAILHLVGAGIASYVTLVHRLPDVRRTARRMTGYLIVTLLSAIVYLAAFFVAQLALQALPGYSSFLPGAALAALVLAATLNILIGGVQRLVNRLVSGPRYDPSQTLSDYSSHISNILEIDRLAEVVLNTIKEAMEIRRGLLFRVDVEPGPDGQNGYHLRGIKGLGDAPVPSGRLAPNSPVAAYLRSEYNPLTQYDIDLLPRFRDTPLDEFMWFSNLAMDVYVPIYAKTNWIGLLALGPKASRDRYYDQDLAVLSTLADQTAVALENARLFDDLVRLNTDLHQAYSALDEANHQLAHLDKLKTDFINIISHELRTPLTIMLGYSEILITDPGVKQNPMQQQMVTGMHNGAVRLREIIESMFDVAKIDSRTLSLNPQPVPIGTLIQGVCDLLQRAVAERKLKLTIEDLRPLPPIEADVEALRKLFKHIITNAIKYTPDGGAIRIYGRMPSDKEIQITIHDSGIGIDPRFRELIFTKFYQTGEVALHSSGQTKFKGGGPGLGLAIARGIAEAHGGRIWAESPGYDEKANPGSQFHVTLPVKHHLTAIEQIEKKKTGPLAGPKV